MKGSGKGVALALVVALVPPLALIAATGDALSDGPQNWTAPPYWTPAGNAEGTESAARGAGRQALVTLSGPLPFVAVTPCRVIDTRAGSGFPAGYGQPSLPGGGAQRTFVINGQCGIPADAQAVSFNFAVWVPTTRGDLRVFPTGATTPLVSTLNWEAGILSLANAAVVPLGAGGAVTVQVDGPGTVDIFVDINGYYSPLGVVNSLNGLGGAVTLAQGTNVTITPSGSTLTIASTGSGGTTGSDRADGSHRFDGLHRRHRPERGVGRNRCYGCRLHRPGPHGSNGR